MTSFFVCYVFYSVRPVGVLGCFVCFVFGVLGFWVCYVFGCVTCFSVLRFSGVFGSVGVLCVLTC